MDVRIYILETLVKFSDFQSEKKLEKLRSVIQVLFIVGFLQNFEANLIEFINFSFMFNLPGSFVIIIFYSLLPKNFLKKFLNKKIYYQLFIIKYHRNGIILIFFKLSRNLSLILESLKHN